MEIVFLFTGICVGWFLDKSRAASATAYAVKVAQDKANVVIARIKKQDSKISEINFASDEK